MLYWTEWSTVARIRKASMDGTAQATIQDSDIQRPYTLVIDIDTQVLFWADHSLSRIEMSNVNGTSRRVVTSISVSQIFSMSLQGNNLYYSDWIFGVRSVNKHGGQAPTTIFDDFCNSIVTYGVQVISLQRQPQGKYTTLWDLRN